MKKTLNRTALLALMALLFTGMFETAHADGGMVIGGPLNGSILPPE